MTLEEFTLRLSKTVTPGLVFTNPGGGTSKVISLGNGKISYQRKSSTMTVKIQALYDAFCMFKNSRMASPDLKTHWPMVFDSHARPAGHSCNVTFLFLCLKEMGFVSQIMGLGKRGNPFYVDCCSP